jgi:hypothetical protein
MCLIVLDQSAGNAGALMKDIADSRAEIDQARLLTLQVRTCDISV